MKKQYPYIFILLLSVFILISCDDDDDGYGTFSFEKKVTLPGSPEMVFDAMTGDISGWWDHSFSEKPDSFYIEPFPGGGFYEYFDDRGNGVKHAEVTFADRGKLLRFEGPLGLTGRAIHMVHTYSFKAAGPDSTSLTVTVKAAGEFEENISGIVEKVWQHFIFDRFKPFMEEIRHKTPGKSG